MDLIDQNEREKRKINASAYALDALAAFARFRTSLPVDMPSEERTKKLEEWTETASLVVCEQIDELDAYSKTDAVYSDSLNEFTVNMTLLALMEVMRVMPYESIINYFSQYFGCDTINEIKERHEQIHHGDDNPIVYGEDG